MTINERITDILRTRDEAIVENDAQKLLSTQRGGDEIIGSMSAGYIATPRMTSVLRFVEEIESGNFIALVRETYHHTTPHDGYLVFHLVDVDNELKIANIGHVSISSHEVRTNEITN